MKPILPRRRSLVELLEGRTLLSATTGAIYGQYYDNANFTNLSFTRGDPGVHFDWQARAPLTRMGTSDFSVRWIGQLRATVDGVYTFTIDSDTTPALTVRGQAIALSATTPGGPLSGTIQLWANQVGDLQLDYVHNSGNARINLDWTPPGQAASSAIPVGNLLNTFAPPPATFTNPLAAGQDPWVIRYHDEYIYTWSDGAHIYASRSPRLQDIGTATPVLLWSAPASGAFSRDVWAPELHQLDGKWYLYFAADDGTNANHRMYTASRNADDPLGSFTFIGKLAATTDRWAIDGTTLDYGGNRYFVWSGWPGTTDGEQDLYIARMSSPTTITGDRVRISVPTYNWEKSGLPINEGPEVIQRAGETHIIFSASGYWTNDYALGDLKLTGSDPMSVASWTKNASPVFSQGNGVVGVGHASFVTSPDGTQDWIVYHAHKYADSFNEDRVVRIQPFTFSGGTPVFGAPISNDIVLTEPSGTPALFAAQAGGGFIISTIFSATPISTLDLLDRLKGLAGNPGGDDVVPPVDSVRKSGPATLAKH